MGGSTPGLILVNADEYEECRAEYETLRVFLTADWDFCPVDASCYGDSLRAIWPKVKDCDWVGLVADDLIPCTSGWDKQLISSLTGWNFVTANDGWQMPARMHGATVWSGELLRAVGWLFPENLRHIFHDDIWETIAKETACWTHRMDIMTRHLHEALRGVRGPTMDPESSLWRYDQAVFQKWLLTDKDTCVTRIRGLMQRFGVRQMRPDFSGVRVMIATPSIDGKYEAEYVVSLYNTMRALHDNGVGSEWADERYTADISLARAKLFAAFLRSKCTHLLMVDADMGWGFEAVLRLFGAKKGFVAIAGPKKRYPLSFAANYTDQQGTPLSLSYDNESYSMEVSEIGAAFALVTRFCAEKLVKAYPELGYDGVTGEPEWAVFNPMIMNRRYFSEDFAFCARLRAIGISIHMVPDVALSHTGSHTFKGAFSETVRQGVPQKVAAE